MEAVPKLPMLNFNSKQTAQKSSFSKLKQYIAEIYHEDAESYSNEIHALETLRSAAYNPAKDVSGCNLIKRYYCQLHSIQNRFPIANDCNLVSFSWRDIYTSGISQSTNIRHDMAVILYNYGALHTQLGAAVNRSTEEEMKLACTHFQCAAWAFGNIRENYTLATSGDLAPELLIFMQQICFAQAQECILEKSLIDNRKAVIVAKVTAQIIEYYNAACAAVLSGSDEGVMLDMVGSKVYKEWRQYVQFKIQYMSCILLLYQGQHSEEQQKMGERVVLYQTACERLEEARKESKGMENIQQINEALSFVGDVVETKRKSAKNENEFIYHEEVPELNTIPTIQGANLVKGISFSVADAEFAAEDIFHRLVPIKTHETSSLYSEEKANILRRINHKVEKKDKELNKFMDSLNIDFLNGDISMVKLPQPLIDRCADLNAKPNAIPDLISKMSALAEICVDVENSLACIKELLCKEELYEQEYQQSMGYRPSSHFVELNREFQKYQEAHNKAGESNDTLRKAMELHVNNLKMLSQPLNDLQAAVPTCTTDITTANLQETRHLLNKVNEMRLQRAQLIETLNENIQKDDITAQLVAWGDKDVDKLFKAELAKHDQLVGIVEQNIVAQSNILKAFTDTYAKCAHVIKAVADAKHRREIFFSSLVASYDVYDDLLGKSLKGLEFYKKLQNNIHKLVHRVRAARDVHDEERQQRLDSVPKKTLATAIRPAPLPQVKRQDLEPMPKLNESEINIDHFHNAEMRPTPIGQETAITSTCITPAGQYNNRATFGIPNNNVKVEPSVLQYSYAPVSQNSTSTPQTYGSHVSSYNSPAVTSNNLPTNYYYDNATMYTSQQGSQAMPISSYGATFSMENAASGYLNPIYSNIQTPQSQTTPMDQRYQNYGYYQGGIATPQRTQDPTDYYNASVSQNRDVPQTSYAQVSSNSTQQPVSMPHQSQIQFPQTQSAMLQSLSSYSQLQPANQYIQSDMTYSSQQPQYSVPQSNQQPTPSQTSFQYNQTNNVNTHSQAGYMPDQMNNVLPSQQITGYNSQSNAYNNSNYGQMNTNQYYPGGPGDYTQAETNYGVGLPPATSMVGNYVEQPNSINSVGYNTSNVGYYGTNMPYAAAQPMAYGSQEQQMPPTNNVPTYPTVNNQAPQQVVPVPSVPAEKPKSKIDLLSEFDDMSISVPTLQPISLQAIKAEIKTDNPSNEEPSTAVISAAVPAKVAEKPLKEVVSKPEPQIHSSLEGLDLNFSLNDQTASHQTVAVVKEDVPVPAPAAIASGVVEQNAAQSTLLAAATPSVNIENFIKDVQRYEKAVNSLTTKTLNGTTPLETKWKELHDILEKDASKKSVAVSKLFPEKNRSMLHVPYDHARVWLPTETDNYINAAHIWDLGSKYNHFILADVPTFNTNKDFLYMIWSQNTPVVVCLSTLEELTQNTFFPRALNMDLVIGEFSVIITSERTLSHTIERRAKLTMTETNATREISIIHVKNWEAKSKINNIVGISQNIIEVSEDHSGETNTGPIIFNCATNCERSSLVAITVTTIMALHAKQPVIANVSDVWLRICSQRKGALKDLNTFHLSMQIVLTCCREYLKMCSLNTPAAQTNYYFIKEEEAPVKDPFKDLDPLWKLK